MESLYSSHIHGFNSISQNSSIIAFGAQWGSQGSLIALSVVLGSSISLVGLAFAFITYSLFSDLRSLGGTALLSLLATLFMSQLLFVIGVGGVEDSDLCVSLSLGLLYMKLASLCWICCCCHHALNVYRTSSNLLPQPEIKMAKMLAHYSMLSWGLPLLMIGIATVFKNKEKEMKSKIVLTQKETVQELLISKHCWLLEGSAYIWAYMVPAIIILFIGFHLALQAKSTAKISAQMQFDSKSKNKIMKRRLLQSQLFVKILVLFTVVNILGSFAALLRINFLWASYSIAHGIQGLITALLVTCNCKILKLYSVPRRKERYDTHINMLHDNERSKFGVLTVTNPNYSYDSISIQDADKLSFDCINYKEESFIERNEYMHKLSSETIDKSNNFTNSLPVNELSINGPPPETV